MSSTPSHDSRSVSHLIVRSRPRRGIWGCDFAKASISMNFVVGPLRPSPMISVILARSGSGKNGLGTWMRMSSIAALSAGFTLRKCLSLIAAR